jgi:hypothetical protein
LYDVVPSNALIVKKDLKARKYFLHKKKILLLPVSEVNNRFNLIFVNLDCGFLSRIKGENYVLVSSTSWFRCREEKETVTTINKLNTEGVTLIYFDSIFNTYQQRWSENIFMK